MNKITAFILCSIFLSVSQANTIVNCQAAEESIFYGVTFELDNSGKMVSACSSTGGYGCLDLVCKSINHLDYECSRTYRRNENNEIVTHRAYVIIDGREIQNSFVIRYIQEGDKVVVNTEKLTFCNAREK